MLSQASHFHNNFRLF